MMINYFIEKSALTAFCAILLNAQAFGQNIDSFISSNPISFKNITTTGLNNFSGEKRKRWIKIDEVTVETFSVALTPVEEELARAESTEIKALIKRDTATLKNIWVRDFTLDQPHHKVHHDHNPLPHYLSLHRRIEKILVTGNHVYVSGTEYGVKVMESSSVDTLVARKYAHMWIKELFDWKLATKTYE